MKQLLIAVLVTSLSPFALAQVPIEHTETDGLSPLTDQAELEAFMDGAIAALLKAHDVAGGTVSVAFVWVLSYWNLLGWNY